MKKFNQLVKCLSITLVREGGFGDGDEIKQTERVSFAKSNGEEIFGFVFEEGHNFKLGKLYEISFKEYEV